nr:hypothetical protein [Candidatus Cloacimonadota bacterium]
MHRKVLLMISIALIATSTMWAQGKEFLFSLAVPGYSQITSGKNYGYAMLSAEAALIGTSLYLSSESDNLLEESYIYALKHANLYPADYDSHFLKNLGRYQSSGFDANGYNATVRRDAQQLFPDDPEAQQNYIEEHAYGEELYWSWDSTDSQAEYNRLRNDSQDLQSYGKLVAGVIILNHLVSGIDVLRYHSSQHRSELSVDIIDRNPILKLSVKF